MDVQLRILSPCLLFKTLMIIMHKTVILSVFLHACETWSPLEEEHRHVFKVSENKVLRILF
jgi:hypothetical protein